MKSQPTHSSPLSRTTSKRKSPTGNSLSPSPPPPPTPPLIPRNPIGSKPEPDSLRSLARSLGGPTWHPLPIPRSELFLPLTLPTAQSFRWRLTSPSVFTGVIGPHLLSLKHAGGHVAFLHHNPGPAAPFSAVEAAILDYFNIGVVSLEELWKGFAAADPRFAELAGRFDGGARVMRQDPVECLFQFLCSSNNNVARIERMVEVISSFGRRLGSVGEFQFYEFPTIERLAMVTEAELREAGFGYRYE